MDERVIKMVLKGDFDVSQLPCHLLAQYFYILLALGRRCERLAA
jgi:hypothetical protein